MRTITLNQETIRNNTWMDNYFTKLSQHLVSVVHPGLM